MNVIHHCQNPMCAAEVATPGYCSPDCRRDHLTRIAQARGVGRVLRGGVVSRPPAVQRRNSTDRRD